MRFPVLVSFFLLIGPTTPMTAQTGVPEDVMEVQRCIWRCQAEFGAGKPAYNACVAQNCNGVEESADAAGDTSSTASDGVWTYGTHPVLGEAAYVTTAGGTFGLHCFDPDMTAQVGNSVSIRMTPDLVPRATENLGAIWVFTDPFVIGGGGTYQGNPAGFVEAKTDACSIAFDDYRKSRDLIFIDATSMGLEATPNFDGTIMTIRQDGKDIRISRAEDLDAVSGKTVIPLKGSSKAIGRFMNACPSARAQLDAGCGSGD